MPGRASTQGRRAVGPHALQLAWTDCPLPPTKLWTTAYQHAAFFRRDEISCQIFELSDIVQHRRPVGELVDRLVVASFNFTVTVSLVDRLVVALLAPLSASRIEGPQMGLSNSSTICMHDEIKA